VDRRVTFALEIPLKVSEGYSPVLREFWGDDAISNPIELFKAAQKRAIACGASFLSVYFNIESESEILYAKEVLAEIVKIAEMRLCVRGSGQKGLDEKLLPELIPLAENGTIIASAQDTNYKAIVKAAAQGEYTIVLRTPIDINLTKELNILSIDAGLKAENILIDPDMGCVGYGLDYGYSIIERIKLAKTAGDKMLEMPVVVFSGEESFKAKESKSADFTPSWGDLNTRSAAWEISTTTALICAGADVVVAWHPVTIETLGGVLC
jgi:acetyl-CoA decarbonylase/synthase complex subunit delta